MRLNPRDHRYGETASSPGSAPLCSARPGNPRNAPPPSINSVCPCGETTKMESPWPTSRIVASSCPGDHRGEKGNVETSVAQMSQETVSACNARLCHELVKRNAAASETAATKNVASNQVRGPGIR